MSTTSDLPRLSVMVPTWNPDPTYLECALRSVLGQLEIGPEIEIALVDDCSTSFDPHAFLERFAGGPIAAHRNDRRLGLAGTWNACLAKARGRWVHILHQDDFVLPGFYRALLRGTECKPEIAAAFCASHLVDANGDDLRRRVVPGSTPGILEDWIRNVFERLIIQCSAIVVRREVCEALGGFDPDFRYALDWDMWKRIAVRYPIWYHPEPLACYRMHAASETARQRPGGAHLAEIFRSIDRSAALLSPEIAPGVTRRARFHYTIFAVESAIAVARSAGTWTAALRQLSIARDATSTADVVTAMATVAARRSVRAVRSALRTAWEA